MKREPLPPPSPHSVCLQEFLAFHRIFATSYCHWYLNRNNSFTHGNFNCALSLNFNLIKKK